MLNQITIKARLWLGTILTCVIIIVMGLIAIKSIERAVNSVGDVYHGSVDAISNLTNLQKSLSSDVISPLQKLHDEVIGWQEAQAALQQWLKSSPKNIEEYLKNFGSDPSYVLKASELQNSIKKTNEALTRLLDVLQKENRQELIAFIEKDLYASTEIIIRQADELIEMHVKETLSDYNTALSDADAITYWMKVTVALTILAAFLLAATINKSILAPLAQAVDTVDQIALGETTMKIEFKGKDESAQLMQAMSNMNESSTKMTDILGAVADGDLTVNVPIRSAKDSLGKGLSSMVLRLRAIISEIQSEVGVLSTSTQEIVSSVNQVSTGTAETAAAVTETTTTVEELKQTAHVSAEKAKDVLANAEETLKVVKNSEKTLQLTMDEMTQIQDKMRIISESIVKLSEHSMTIGQIINTVNNLAEQSNLLAVNAAIEAAKAGDQGKSFGVVAQEIRTLAEQSKEATFQVRAILNDIQNATGAAVLATEQGSKAVSKGVLQSSQLTDAIHTLSSSISRVAQAANQISISSQQQLIGVDQVTVAMTSINDASSQHVEHMRQIEIAISSLNDVTISLSGLVNQYKILPNEKTALPRVFGDNPVADYSFKQMPSAVSTRH